jgi:hypothetical protein
MNPPKIGIICYVKDPSICANGVYLEWIDPDDPSVNTVSPGVIKTPMHANDDHTTLAKFHPLVRMGEISDTVDAVLYPQNATFVTGENIRVDGGGLPVDNDSSVAKPGSRFRELGLVLPQAPSPLGSRGCVSGWIPAFFNSIVPTSFSSKLIELAGPWSP